MSEDLHIQWYPGHMTKTRREIEALLKEVDMVAEVLDARLPLSSRNPDIGRITADKPGLILLNKSDLADPNATRLWSAYFRAEGYGVMTTDCRSGSGVSSFREAACALLADKIARNRERGLNKAIRVMVCGIPNVGKSALINRLSGARKTKVEDRPGVTRGKQWIAVGKDLLLLDTPGVLWPKFDDPEAALRLAFTGAIRDNVLDSETLALRLIETLCRREPQALPMRYGVDIAGKQPIALFEEICRRRGMVISGGEPDYERCAAMLLDEFRGGRMGRITLELPSETGGKKK